MSCSRGIVFTQKGRSIYLMKYYRDGVPHRESTGTTDKEEAQKILTARIAAIDKGIPHTAAVGKVRWEDGVRDLIIQCENDKIASVKKYQLALDLHLTPFFAKRKLSSIDDSLLAEYINQRRKATFVVGSRRMKGKLVVGKAGTIKHYETEQINFELRVLRRVLRLQVKRRRLAWIPEIVIDPNVNVRDGHFSKDDLDLIVAEMEPAYAGIAQLAFTLGWRIVSELLTLEWAQVSFEGKGEIRIARGKDKSRKGRTFPMTSGIRTLLLARKRERDLLRKAGFVVPWVFWRIEDWRLKTKGTPIPIKNGAWMGAWKRARIASGVEGIPHDFRRTAIRNFSRLGIPRKQAMQCVGHKTEHVYERYNILDEADAELVRSQLDLLALQKTGTDGGE